MAQPAKEAAPAAGTKPRTSSRVSNALKARFAARLADGALLHWGDRLLARRLVLNAYPNPCDSAERRGLWRQRCSDGSQQHYAAHRRRCGHIGN